MSAADTKPKAGTSEIDQRCIDTIRTLTIDEGAGVGRLGLGSGLVVDSEAGSEWAECLAKGRFLAGA